MSGKELTKAAEQSSFVVLQEGKIDDAMKAIQGNLGNAGGFENLLDKITLPTGKGTAFEIPSIEGDLSEKEFSAIIVGWQDHRVFYEKSFDGSQLGVGLLQRGIKDSV